MRIRICFRLRLSVGALPLRSAPRVPSSPAAIANSVEAFARSFPFMSSPSPPSSILPRLLRVSGPFLSVPYQPPSPSLAAVAAVRPLYSFEVAAPSFRISPFVSQRRRSDGPIREEGERERDGASRGRIRRGRSASFLPPSAKLCVPARRGNCALECGKLCAFEASSRSSKRG